MGTQGRTPAALWLPELSGLVPDKNPGAPHKPDTAGDPDASVWRVSSRRCEHGARMQRACADSQGHRARAQPSATVPGGAALLAAERRAHRVPPWATHCGHRANSPGRALSGFGAGGSPSFLQLGLRNISPLQFSSVAQSYPTLCNLMNYSTPGLPVHHQLPESTQTHAHLIGDPTDSEISGWPERSFGCFHKTVQKSLSEMSRWPRTLGGTGARLAPLGAHRWGVPSPTSFSPRAQSWPGATQPLREDVCHKASGKSGLLVNPGGHSECGLSHQGP